MKPRITIITLGVTDLPRAIRFYRDGLGFPTDAKDDAAIAIFMTNGVRLALYRKKALAEDISNNIEVDYEQSAPPKQASGGDNIQTAQLRVQPLRENGGRKTSQAESRN